MPTARDRGRGISAFDNAPAPLSMADADSFIFGDIASVDKAKQTAAPVSIFNIWPDLTQPRRTMPSVVRAGWDGSPTSVGTLLEHWFYLATQEKGEAISVAAYIEASADDQPERSNIGPIEDSLLDLLSLAGSIYRDGLTNPVTAVRKGAADYRLETGERRWLGFHLLYAYKESASEWGRIPVRVVSDANVWRQASENTARANLNAISRARQLAILLMDLLTQAGATFQSFDEVATLGGTEREYYAQVADGDEFRIPRGKSEMLLSAMGLKNPTQLRQYRALLRIPDTIWKQADDENWEEGVIRQIIAGDENIGNDTVTGVTVNESISVAPTPPAKGSPPARNVTASAERFVQRTVRQAASASPEVRRGLIDMLRKAISDLEKL